MESDLVSKLRQKSADFISVESCTGGLIAHRITNVSGSSDIFWGGLVVYDNRAKQNLARVPEKLLEKYGAVSLEVAQSLAQGALQVLTEGSAKKLHYSAATTGIAGPSGGSAEKPVGLCFVAVASSSGRTLSKRVQSPHSSDRELNKKYFADQALTLLQELLNAE